MCCSGLRVLVRLSRVRCVCRASEGLVARHGLWSRAASFFRGDRSQFLEAMESGHIPGINGGQLAPGSGLGKRDYTVECEIPRPSLSLWIPGILRADELGEWKDGTAVYLDPSFAPAYMSRMTAHGWTPSGRWSGYSEFLDMNDHYKGRSLRHLRTIAQENNLQFIVQFRDVPYRASPVFANESFAVYRQSPGGSRGR